MIDSDGLVIGIVPLWLKDQVWSKLRIAPQCLDAFYDITGIQFKNFSSNDYLSAVKFWATRKFFINDLV
jgi:hypothetical protein